jgi:hypothetical protein
VLQSVALIMRTFCGCSNNSLEVPYDFFSKRLIKYLFEIKNANKNDLIETLQFCDYTVLNAKINKFDIKKKPWLPKILVITMFLEDIFIYIWLFSYL